MAPAELSGVHAQKGAPAHRGQTVLVLPLRGFSPDPTCGTGGWDLLLAGYTESVTQRKYWALLHNHHLKKDDSTMCRIQNVSKHRFHFKFQVPSYIRQEFLQESVRKNNFSFRIICAIFFVSELYNLFRVVFLSQSGLRTRNNQIYFSMYCILILLAILWLVLRHALRQAPVRCQWVAQHVVTTLIFLWHIGLNTYDLYRDPAAGTTVLTTALMGLAFLIQSPPWYSVMQSAVNYLLFRVFMAPLMDTGDRLNLTITFVVALAVSLANAHHTSVTLKQQKQIVEINTKLQELVHLDPLTGLLNKTTVECWAEQLLHDLEHTGRPSGLTLFLMDLDEFKRINDRYGHPCGDYVLAEAAETMRRVFSDATGLGRIGGDEFAVLYDRPMTEEYVLTLGRELGKQLRKIQWQEQPLDLQCSMGVCICTQPQFTYQQLYAETDRMLYRSKETGRGRCCVQQLECADNKRFQENMV